MDVKEFIRGYYRSLLDPEEVKNFVHPHLTIQWYSTRGYIELDADEIIKFASQLSKTYLSLRLEISHIVAESNKVSVRYANHVTTAENPFEEKVLSHSIAIWELKDGLLYRGYVMSHAD